MELELSLVLPNQNSMKGFDLNKSRWAVNKPKEKVGLNDPWSLGHCSDAKKREAITKRSFDEAFGETEDHESSLLVWNGQPNEEDDRHGKQENPSCPINVEQGNRIVGWPPIKSWRKKLMQQRQGYHCHQVENTMYVKVKMEGVSIVRKVDLRLYNSYQMLKSSLIAMFAKYRKVDTRHENYTLTYLDKEGNWLSAGDVPWRIFMDSVQRLEIFKNRG